VKILKSIFKKLGALLSGLITLLLTPPKTNNKIMEQQLKMYPYHYMG